MVLDLAEELDVPLRERNRMLLAAGCAPAFDVAPELLDEASAYPAPGATAPRRPARS